MNYEKRNNENTIEYDGYLYNVSKKLNSLSEIIDGFLWKDASFLNGDFMEVSKDNNFNVRFEIIDNQLNIISFDALIDIPNKDKIPDKFNGNIKFVKEKYKYFESNELLEKDAYRIEIKDIAIPCCYTGTIKANQYYIDEMTEGHKVHPNISVFCFKNGNLIEENSFITKSNELFISQYIWQENFDHSSRTGLFTTQGGIKGFLFEPTGIVIQQMRVFESWFAYRLQGDLGNDTIKELLNYEKPTLRVEFMWQKSDDLDSFEKKVYDLPILAMRRLDLEKLRLMYDYVLSNEKAGYSNSLAYELFHCLRNPNEAKSYLPEDAQFDWNKCIEILIFLFRRDFKCTNSENIIEEIKLLAPNNAFQASLAARYIKEMDKQ